MVYFLRFRRLTRIVYSVHFQFSNPNFNINSITEDSKIVEQVSRNLPQNSKSQSQGICCMKLISRILIFGILRGVCPLTPLGSPKLTVNFNGSLEKS